MAHTQYNILVPIDFTQKDRWAIAKAIELANTLNCNIHLVYVELPQIIDSGSFSHAENAGQKLRNLKEEYQHHLCNGKMEISLVHGYPQAALKKYIEQYNMDMVIKGMSKFNLVYRVLSSVSISRLARITTIPVLAVCASGLVSHFKKILLPLDKHVPVHRIRIAVMLGRYFKSTIYVISLRGEDSNLSLLNKTLEIMQSLTTVPVQSIILEGKNLAQATLDFSKKINADLIMITSRRAFFLPGLWNLVTRKLLSYKSKIPVLTLDNK